MLSKPSNYRNCPAGWSSTCGWRRNQMSARTDRMRFQRSRSRIVMVTPASCRIAGLRTPERGANHCRNLTPGGHLNLARTGHFYLALIHPGRIRCDYVKQPGTCCRETAAKGPTSPRLGLTSGGQVSQLPGVRSGILRSRSRPGRARSQSLRPGHSVNHVSGMRCKPCDRNTPQLEVVARDGIEPSTRGFSIALFRCC